MVVIIAGHSVADVCHSFPGDLEIVVIILTKSIKRLGPRHIIALQNECACLWDGGRGGELHCIYAMLL